MADSAKADIIVGIDFGMTCTGVAYPYGPEWPRPKTIQRWPGKMGHEVQNKVETSIAYRLDNGSRSKWGFLCNPDDEAYEYNSLFKLYLDPYHKDTAPDPPSHADARVWFKDYMRYLYQYLISFFENVFPRFPQKRVEYVFSIPVTWRKNPTLVADIEALVREAGFGERAGDSATVALTEAEAAAIYASRGSMSNGDVILVCDAGGGTTDLNSLKVTRAMKGNIELFPLSWTEGASVGSALIDFRIRSTVILRLEAVRDYLPQQDLADTATQLMPRNSTNSSAVLATQIQKFTSSNCLSKG